MIDVVIPSHWKDIDTLDHCIEGIRNNVKDVRRIIVVSKDKMTDNAEHYDEKDFPFSFDDVGEIVGFHKKTCNYYGGLIQTTSALVIPDLCDNVLVCDSDTVFLKETEFIKDNKALYNVSYDLPKGMVDHPYIEHMGKLFKGLKKQTEYSGICHHMLIQKDILQEMFDRAESEHKMPFWKADIFVTQEHYKSFPSKKTKEDVANAPLLFTTYELYFNYVMQYHRDRVDIRKQKSILSYKGRLGYEGENIENVKSRTNLMGNVQVLNPELEKTFNFDSTKDAIAHTIKCIKDTNQWDVVTFQNHQRMGIDLHNDHMEKTIKEKR